MIKVTDLLQDGIYLAEGDIIAFPDAHHKEDREGISVTNPTWFGKEALNWVSTGRFEGWYVKEFSKRTSFVDKPTECEWLPVIYNEINGKPEGSEGKSTIGYIDESYFNFAIGDYWKPHMESLMEHYNEDKPLKEETDMKKPSSGTQYTEDMLGEGIVTTVGMAIPLEDGDSEVMAVRFCQELFTLVLETKGGWVTMGELVFPKVKTLREVVIEEMISKRDSVIGAQSDEYVMGKLYDTVLRVTKESE